MIRDGPPVDAFTNDRPANALSQRMLRSGFGRVSYSLVISTLVLPYPATRGDSRLGRIVSRVCSAEAVVGRVCALVAVVVRSRPEPGDRTLLRLLASLLAHLLAPVRRAMGGVRGMVRPDGAWSITQRTVTSICVSAVRRTPMRNRAAHPLPYRAAAAESPAAFARPVQDETRDSDQRDSARNPGRHSRGRRVR